MGKRALRKQQLRAFLLDRDKTGLATWMHRQRNPDRVLMGLLFDPDPLVRWRAIEGIGQVAAIFAKTDRERVREMIRRLMWLMNDESGGLVWNAPEAVGMVLIRLPDLVNEYGRILASHIHEEPFERGTHWALSQIVPMRPAPFADMTDELAAALKDPDPYIRAYALPALLALSPGATDRAAPLLDDTTSLRIWDPEQGDLRETTVGTMARQAIDQHRLRLAQKKGS